MRFRSLTLVPALVAAAMLGGCTIHHVRGGGTVRASGSVRVTTPTYVTVSDAPPPLKPAVRTRPAHSSGTVWIEGHWTWNGGWVWVDGRWDSPPQPGYVWEPPVVVAVASGGYQFHRGYWRPRDRQPPAVYRTDGTIRVHVRSGDEPARANRVVVRAGEPPPSRVVVTGSAREGRSSNVTVRTSGSATVRTRPADDRGNATVRTRPSDDRGNATVRGNDQSANARVRPASEARGNDQRANTTVRPSSMARGNDQRANTTVRPASMARGNDQSANTQVGNGQQGPRSCQLRVAVLPRNGVLVIRGSGLAAATGVMIGSQRVPILDKRDDRLRARVQGRNHGGSVKVLFGNERESCGTLRITGR